MTALLPLRALLETARQGRRTLIMGILNITPDSFSDGGLLTDPEEALLRAEQMSADGADILDVGGESTRPSTFTTRAPLSAEEEKRRILPVIAAIAQHFPKTPISVDTYKADVAAEALDAGAVLINDISALRADDARLAGIAPENIIVDPGFGFGKNVQENLELLRRLHELTELGYPVLSGTSRKSTIGKVLGGLPPSERLEGTAATVALSIAQGAAIVRVHDVREMTRVARMSDAITRGWTG
jgi:dihydropteroate synthase